MFEFKHTNDEHVNLNILADAVLRQINEKSMIQNCVVQVPSLLSKSELHSGKRMWWLNGNKKMVVTVQRSMSFS